MSDSISESDFHTDYLDQQHKNDSSFKVTGLSVGINAKNHESDSVRSPTSTLDFRIFSSTGNPIKSPRSQNEEGQRKSWDCSKVGLSIIDSLDVEATQSGKVVRSSDSKNILFGYQTNVRSSKFYSHFNSLETPKSLPKEVAVFPSIKTKRDNIQKGDSTILFEIRESPKESFRSCSLDCGKLNLSLTDFGSSKLGSPNLVPENKVNLMPSKSNFLEGSVKSGNSLEGRMSSICHSDNCFISSVPPSEIELSEDYTCIRDHGPQSKVTHIFRDCILECHDDKLNSFLEKSEDHGMVNSSDLASYPTMDFMKFCYSCKKSLDGEDIFMYRGEKAFCSLSCRSWEILVDEEVEKTNVTSSEKNKV